MKYHYVLKLEFAQKDYDFIIDFLYENGVTAFEEGESAQDDDGNFYIKNEYSLITIRNEDLDELKLIKEQLVKKAFNIKFTELDRQDNFIDEWKKFAVPIQITQTITVCPSWLAQEVGQNSIILDAAYAFGSGSHETTKLCAEEIERQKGAKTLLDVGCGSGILSLVASKLGYLYCKGIDIDPLAVDAAKNNALRNSFNNLEFSNQSLNQITEKYDVVVANILSTVLLDLRKDLINCVKPGGVLILSGILTNEIDTLIKNFNPKMYNYSSLNEWAFIVCSEF